MKKLIATAAAVLMVCALTAAGAEDLVYGTMQIPYSAFYAAEGVADVDAVTSATNAKWKNPSLAAGTYAEAHTEDAGGDILGVVYPVVISADDLAVLGDNNYGFAATDAQPAAYKLVTVTDGAAAFSAVQGDTAAVDAKATLSTSTMYGDYEVEIDAINNTDGTSSVGTIYGVLLNTEDGAVYALRHLENIWRDELSWSCGFSTVEVHGNAMVYAPYADMMGKTITGITFITETGYHTLATSLYVPVKFDGGVSVNDAAVAAGTTAVTVTGMPDDFSPAYAVNGLEGSADAEAVSWTGALPGFYTLTVADESGKYAPLSASFVLSTDELPVTYDAASMSLVPAEGADEATANAFIANISNVSVNGTDYAVAGHGAVAIIDVEGMLDTDAELVSGRGADAVSTPIFPETGDYELTVTSTGFNQTITFTVAK